MEALSTPAVRSPGLQVGPTRRGIGGTGRAASVPTPSRVKSAPCGGRRLCLMRPSTALPAPYPLLLSGGPPPPASPHLKSRHSTCWACTCSGECLHKPPVALGARLSVSCPRRAPLTPSLDPERPPPLRCPLHAGGWALRLPVRRGSARRSGHPRLGGPRSRPIRTCTATSTGPSMPSRVCPSPMGHAHPSEAVGGWNWLRGAGHRGHQQFLWGVTGQHTPRTRASRSVLLIFVFL